MKILLSLLSALFVALIIFFILAKAIETEPLEIPKENIDITIGSNPLDEFERYCDLQEKEIKVLIASSKSCETTFDCAVEILDLIVAV